MERVRFADTARATRHMFSRRAVGHDGLARVVDDEIIDPRIRVIRVRVEKLDVFADAASAGVEVKRRNN
jgi:hypothetical protein